MNNTAMTEKAASHLDVGLVAVGREGGGRDQGPILNHLFNESNINDGNKDIFHLDVGREGGGRD